ncbi:hypothetical protein BCR41DRAFT_215499 [Lobosporangium transversale]|uniref:Uncharacterized protein n=1 Tax=Lobosporangium transversale TaxID=64571 RepID=A0A1Y2G6Z1_9FUNG|nr:hypothetical protein BCR41DRAFT_215499 [Lobosporangium transversale]ORY99573.1 hypothetical protein BCR41DRAFT_215499 [Lobosporangium transversale]|eukprot:XP_021875868.1 hypothetical protein BCR41DRAFT_215499 [Lobosporangium transversale]
MRKTGSGADVNVLGQELIEIMIQVLSIPSFFISGIEESKGMFGTCFSGLAMGLDKWSGLMEPKIMDGLVAGLKLGRVSAQDTDMEGIQASLATVLRSNVLNESPEPIKELITAFLQDFYGASSSAAPTLSTAKILSVSSVVSNIDELFQVLRLFQFVVTHKAGLVTVKDDEGDKDKKRKKKKSKPKKAVQLKGVTWFEALIQALQDTSNNATIPSLLAVAGILRAIQHAEDDPPRVDADSLALIQDLFVTSLRVITEELKGTISSPEDNIAISNASVLSSRIQACLVFATSQTIPNLPACKLEALDSSLLADLLLDYVLQQNEQKGVIPITEIFRTIAYEIAQQQQPQPNRLKLNGMTHQLLTTTTKGPLFTEIGRIARTIATLIETMDDWGKIEHLLERMHSFAINIHVDWSRCSLSSYDSFVIEGQQQKSEPRPEPDPETSKSMAMLFQVFKTVLFAYTMIFGSINEKWENATVGLTSQFDFLILDSYAHLFFITYKLGPGSFQVYEELITSILTRMVTSEGIAATLQDTDKDGESSNHHVLLNKTLKRMKPRAELGLYDPVMESRTLFYMNLLERIMIAIEEPFLEHELLPMVYPYLLKNDQRDLFESAHSVIMSVFLTNKTIAKQLAPYYSNLLLQHFPDQINIDQLRAAFTTMIKSLSETEDALAWLCVEKLLEKIQQYDTVIEADIKAQELSQNEQEKAVAALAKEQQERDSEKALVQVATEVYQDLSPQDSATQLPSLNTPTPSPPPLSSAVPPATSSSSYSSSSSVTKTTASIASLELQKERGQILLALFDQLSSLNLVFVQTLGDKIRELLSKEQSPVSRKALLKCILDVVGGPSVDQTKRDWAVKWYLGLVNEFGRGSSSSSLSSSLSTPISMSLHKH